jgi:hypothetical protein
MVTKLGGGFSALPALVTLTGEDGRAVYYGRGFWKKFKKFGKKAFSFTPAGIAARALARKKKKPASFLQIVQQRAAAAKAAAPAAAAAPKPASIEQEPATEENIEETTREEAAPEKSAPEDTQQEAAQDQTDEGETSAGDSAEVFSSGIMQEERNIVPTIMQGVDKAAPAENKIFAWIKKNPAPCIAIAAASGITAGALIFGKKKHKR